MRKKRVVIEASSIMPFGDSYLTGVARTTLELIKALEQIDDLPIEVILFGQRFSHKRFQRYNFSFPVRYLRLPRWRVFNSLRTKFPLVEFLTDADLIHITNNFAPIYSSINSVVTIHDAMFLVYPEKQLHSADDTADILRLGKSCRKIITCSESSKKDLIHYGGISADKIDVIYWGVDQKKFFKIEESRAVTRFLQNRFRIINPFYLSVSCSVGRKNSPVVVSNYLKLADKGTDHHLVMVWSQPPLDILEMVTNHPKGKNVHFLSNISDKELRYLYNGASVLLFPSSYEGFGLPVLESMACGTPVITSNSSSLPEVGGNAAIYIDTRDGNALLREMENFHNRTYSINDMSRKCQQQANKFSWHKCAVETLKVYCDLL